MSNKTDLQANNARIEAFIADGQDLPPALPSELGNATTADVLSGKTFTSDDGVMQTGGLAPNGFGSAIATDVLIGKTFSSATGIFQNGKLDPETLKNGQYVWKKYEKEELKAGSFTVTNVSDSPVTLQLSSDDYNINDYRNLNGFTANATENGNPIILTFDKGIYEVKRDGNYYSSGYTLSGNKLTLYGGILDISNLVWQTPIQSDGGYNLSFIGYVVSDNESAYPDGGEQDGFWYERVVEGVAGVDSGTITLSSSRSFSIEHSLGKVPQVFALTRPDNSGETDIVRGICYPSGAGGGETYARGVDATSGFSILYHLQIDSTKVTGTADSETKHLTGTYIWFVA